MIVMYLLLKIFIIGLANNEPKIAPNGTHPIKTAFTVGLPTTEP